MAAVCAVALYLSAFMDGAVLGDVEVVADVGEAAVLDVVALAGFKRVVLGDARGGAVDDDKVMILISLIDN